MDGGYYAIKGFEYQIDKTILEILSCENENTEIGIENIQDINSNDFVIQVKYKEAKKFFPSSIREPIIQLIDEFDRDRNKNYYLYAYFYDLNGYDIYIGDDKRIKLDLLDKILDKKNTEFTTSLKSEFLKNFYLDFSSAFQDQFDDVIRKLKVFSFCGSSDDEAILYYSNIANFLRKLVVKNTISTERKCSRREVFDYIKNGRRVLFDSTFRDYKGEKEYFKFIKKKYFTFLNPTDYERFVIIELLGNESISDVKQIILSVKDKFYKSTNRNIKSDAPYIYIKNINEEMLVKLKTELLSDGCFFKDGHDFYNASFY